MVHLENKTGVLLVNLGTPDAATPAAVRRYLAEFLWDSRVVEIPRLIWWPILHGIVLTVRPRKSAKAYQSIWTDRGSPLLAFTEDLGAEVDRALKQQFGDSVVLTVAMRYGNPSVPDRLRWLREAGAKKVVVMPLYPQYSNATTASTLDAVYHGMSAWRHIPELAFISDYHSDPGYIRALASSIQESWQQNGRGELLLMSFHGLPAKSKKLGDPYYQQCVDTGHALAAELDLQESKWCMVFQSRFGAEEWLKPYCIDVLRELPQQGIRSIDVVCPGFSVDCLETLEEIAIANKEVFEEAGGERYHYIPALNSRSDHAQVIASLIQRRIDGRYS